MTRTFAAIVALATSQPALAQVTNEQLEREAAAAFEQMAPVGMAVAVVREGEPVWLQGYGSLELGGNEPVNADTAFPIHSMTKSFTSAALALLVDEGKIAWSDPVRKHIPEFEMSDPYVTEHMTVRDLLVHNSGLALGAGDLLHWPDQASTTGEFISALKYLPLETSFREGFAYDNILYMVAGEVVARASGMPWGEFVQARLFAPLGMTSCSTSSAGIRAASTAIQHSREPGGEPAARADIRMLEEPSGSISCSVRDVAKWTQLQLSGGKLTDGRQLLSPDRIREMHTPVVTLGLPNFMRRLGNAHFNNVALGWFTSDFAGTLLVEHGGTGPGGLTNMVLLPEKDAAVVVLVNDMVPATFLTYRFADLIVRGDEASDWIEYVIGADKGRAARFIEARQQQGSAPANAAAPSLPLDAYAGSYRDPWYGEIVVGRNESGLTLHFPRSKLLNGPLVQWDGDTFLARWPDRSLDADALVTFVKDADGKIASMKLRALSDSTDFSYDYQHLAPVRIGD